MTILDSVFMNFILYETVTLQIKTKIPNAEQNLII